MPDSLPAMPTPEPPLSGEILRSLVALSHFLGDPAKNLAILGEGNTSARSGSDAFWVKASGQHLGTITPEGFCQVRFAPILAALDNPTLTDSEVKAVLRDAKIGGDPEIMPSVETFFHAALLTLSHVTVIGHTHPVAVNAILCSQNAEQAVSGRLFPDEVVCCGVAPCWVEYADPGIGLARLIWKRVHDFHEQHGEWPKIVLLQNHGLIALGRSPKDVETATLMYNKVAQTLVQTYAVGGPRFLSASDVQRIHTRPDEHYRQKQLGQRG